MRNFITILIIFCTVTAYAQADYVTKQTSLKVSGTSTLHDWEMESKEVKITAQIKVENGRLVAITQLKLELPAESLKSGKSAMDNNAYKSLKTNSSKTITFTLTSATIHQESGHARIVGAGKMVIAGTAKNVEIEAQGTVKSDGSVQFTGSYPLKMSDYQVEPPTFMFGTVTTGDAVTIGFDVNLLQASSVTSL